MTLGESTRSKAQAAVSEATADVRRLEAELVQARAKLKRAEIGDSVVDKVTDIPVVRENTEALRLHSEANVAEAQAVLDRLTAELNSARNRLKWAQRGLNTVDNVTDAVTELTEVEDDAPVLPETTSEGTGVEGTKIEQRD